MGTDKYKVWINCELDNRVINNSNLIFLYFQLAIGGYNNKQHILLQKIMEKLTHFKIDPKRFAICKDNVINLHITSCIKIIYFNFFLVYSEFEKLFSRTTLSTCSLLFDSSLDWTLMDQTRVISGYWSWVFIWFPGIVNCILQSGNNWIAYHKIFHVLSKHWIYVVSKWNKYEKTGCQNRKCQTLQRYILRYNK